MKTQQTEKFKTIINYPKSPLRLPAEGREGPGSIICMLGLLEGVEEYNNSGALIGIDYADDNEVIGALRRMNPIKRMRMVSKLSNTGSPSRGSRAEMEKHFGELPAHIKEQLANGTLRLADATLYSIKPVSSKTIKIFETQDQKEVGLRNVTSARLPKNQVLLVSGIFLLAGVSVDATKDKIMATEYKGLENFHPLVTGEFSLKANKKVIVPETSNLVFKTASLHQVPLGYYKLANPRLIEDDLQIEMTIELGTMDGVAANTYILAGLHGTITTP